MPHFKFVINDSYLLYFALTRPITLSPFSEWKRVVARLRRQFPEAYKAIVTGIDYNLSLVLADAHTTHNSFIIHALIELTTDNELRLRLHGKGKYFYVGKKYTGHDHIRYKRFTPTDTTDSISS